MAASNLNLLSFLNSKPNAATGSALPNAYQNDTSSSVEAGRHFAKLVKQSSDTVRDNDSSSTRQSAIMSRKTDTENNTRDDHDTASSTASSSTSSTRSARTDNDSSSSQDWHDTDRTITPREAAKALKALDDKEKSGDASADLDADTITKVKAQLQAIVDSGQPAKLSDVLAAATGKDPKELIALFANANAQATTEVTALAGAVKKVLGFLDKALRQTGKKETETANADTDASATATSTTTTTADNSAQMQPDPLLAAQAQAQADAQNVTKITPLANTIIFPQATTDTKIDSTVATAAPVDNTISAVDLNGKRSAIDERIPPLALMADEKSQDLPEIELPKADFAAAMNGKDAKTDANGNDAPTATNSTTTGNAPAPKAADASATAQAPQQAPSNIERQLQALSASAQFVVPANAKEEGAPQVVANNNTNGTGQVTAIGGVSASAAAGNITGTSAVTSVANAAGNAINHAPVREQVSVAISKAGKEGVEQVTIALEPQGLGRVEVKMHTGHDGQTQISFLVDKPDTFDALARDARGLERSLQEAGIKADSGSMQFNLRQQPQQSADMGGNRQGSQQQASNGASASTTTTAEAAPVTRTYRVGVQDGIDIHA